MEGISVAINDSFDVVYFDLYLISFDIYLINVLAKSAKAERCRDIMFKLTLYCLTVTVEDINLWRRYRYEDINYRCEDINILGTRYFGVLDSTLSAR